MNEKLEKFKDKIIDRYFEVVDEEEQEIMNLQEQEEEKQDKPQLEVRKVNNPTVISEGTIIQGHIKATQDIKIQGKIIGNIYVEGSVYIEQGEVIGDIKANHISISASRIKGNIESIGQLEIQTHSQVEGFLKAESILIDSECKGDVFAEDMIRLLATARLIGNIQTKRIDVEEGAYLEGELKMNEK